MKGAVKYFAFIMIVLPLCFEAIHSLPAAHAADNPVLSGGTNRADRGSSYWQTSNLREWLNSSAAAGGVKYTQKAPDYAGEAGFLHDFTTSEQTAIAVTRHRVWISTYDGSAKDGGAAGVSSGATIGGFPLTFGLSELANQHNNYDYQVVSDKVFIPNVWEAYLWEERRGWSIAKSDLSGSAANWWANAPLFGLSDSEQNAFIGDNGQIGFDTPTNRRGVAPMISLKPTAKVNGQTASALKIGSTLSFGHYAGSALTWRIINRTSNGAPVLQTERVIAQKAFDAAGDLSYEHSTTTNFSAADVDLTSDPYAPNPGQTDTDFPYLDIKDDSLIFSRQNNPYTLTLTASDTGSGVDHVVLPDGSTTKATTFAYKIDENKTYSFKVVDKAGNWGYLTLPITNINPPSSVVVQPSASSWTNKPVTVLVAASNQAGFSNRNVTTNGRDYTLYSFPNYTTYAGKTMHLKGTVTLKKADGDPGTIAIGFGLYYDALVKNGHEYILQHRWPTLLHTTLTNLQENGSQTWDADINVPTDYNTGQSIGQGPRAILHMDVLNTDKRFTVSWTNVSYTLVDNDDFNIKSITLPSGKVVSASTYTDTLSSSGDYAYKVTDNRGKVTEKTISVHIDTAKPTLTVKPDRTYPARATKSILHVTAADTGGSGISQIKTPDGVWHNGSSLDYAATSSGTYAFSAKDAAGNTSTTSVKVTLDTAPPSLSVTGNPASTVHKPVALHATATDNLSVKRIQTPNGTWHSSPSTDYTVYQNGDYTFVAEDAAGNQTKQTVNVKNIGDLLYATIPEAGSGNGGGSGSGDVSGNATSAAAELTGGANQTTFKSSIVHVEDNRQTATGWSIVLTADRLSGTDRRLPEGSLQMKSPDVKGDNNDPVSPLNGYQPIDTDTPLTVLEAVTGKGAGAYDFDAGAALKVAIPASAYKGTYKTTLVWQIVSAP